MKFSIHGFNQKIAVELGLNSTDLLVLRWFCDFIGTPRIKTVIDDGVIFYWIDYKTVLSDLPILSISKQTLRKKTFNNLCETGVLIRKHITSGGSFSYFSHGKNYEKLIYEKDIDTLGIKEYPLGTNVPTPSYDYTNPLGMNLPNKDSSTINTSTINNEKENIKRKEVTRYFEDDTLNDTFLDFLEVRKKIKAVNSEYAITLLLNELKAYDDVTKLAMINKSIVNSWKGVFPITKEPTKKVEKKVVEPSAWVNNHISNLKNNVKKL